ncbi:glucoamylase [Mycena latifolia]|nr:glucoamylase [Mycena latifolia]
MEDLYKESLWSYAYTKIQDLAQMKMRVVLFSALSICGAVLAQSSVDSYIATESPIVKAGMLANIGASGARAEGAKAGIVIASPNTTLLGHIHDFVSAERALQQVSNPSGTISTGGLGEPKFNVDETAFTGSWGRLQRDGPALRATAMIAYANWLLKNTTESNVVTNLWPTIKLDLDYVAANWNQTEFDLWEEVSSSSFTTVVQHRSLREGAALATAPSVVSKYETQATNTLCFLQTYWSTPEGYMTANTESRRSGKDANTVLASIHAFDPAAGCDRTTFQPCSDKALSNLKVYVDSFRSIYAVNSGIEPDAAVATGRYPEDTYMGGNPWYLTTAAVAEQLYDALIVWEEQGYLNVSTISYSFFKQFLPSVSVGYYEASTSTFKTLTSRVKKFADEFLAIHAKFTYDRKTGAPLSAVDLTWSYAAALTAFSARAGKKPASWGAAGLVAPKVCQSNNEGTVAVTFNVDAKTILGESIYLVGSVDALKNWSPEHAIIMSAAKYPIWSITINVPASTVIEYKYIRKQNGVVTWESGPNNKLTTPESGKLTVDDSWRY